MRNITASMLPSLLGRPVAYQAVFTRLPGVNVQGAIFLSQALFLCNTPTAQRRDGWFWKEQEGPEDSWESETGMSAKQQSTARRQLVALGVLEEARKGMPAKTWYRVNADRLAELLARALGEQIQAEQPANLRGCPDSPNGRNKKLPTGETCFSQTEPTDSTKGSFLTETTTENTPSLSGAGTSPCDRAKQLDDDGLPPSGLARSFPMSYDWVPDPSLFAAMAQRRGMTADTRPTPTELADFTGHFAENSRPMTHGGWHDRLARWIHENRQRQPMHPQALTGGSDHAQRRQPDCQGDERRRVREALADPHDISWADGWWPGDDHEAAAGSGAGAGGTGVHPSGGDLSEDVLECVPECGPVEAEQTGAGAGDSELACATDSHGGGASNEQSEARGQYMASDYSGSGLDAGADSRGLRNASSW